MKPIAEPIWLVVRDKYKTPVSVQQYPANTDPIPVMVGAMAKSLRLGFTIEHMPGNIAVYFCCKDDERNEVALERADPMQPLGANSSSRFYAKPEPTPLPNNVTPIKR